MVVQVAIKYKQFLYSLPPYLYISNNPLYPPTSISRTSHGWSEWFNEPVVSPFNDIQRQSNPWRWHTSNGVSIVSRRISWRWFPRWPSTEHIWDYGFTNKMSKQMSGRFEHDKESYSCTITNRNHRLSHSITTGRGIFPSIGQPAYWREMPCWLRGGWGSLPTT